MTPAQRLELALRPYQFALDAVRTTEKQRHAGGTSLARHAAHAGGSKAGQVKTMEQVRDYELKAFFTYVIEVLERLGIAYMVVGGFAATSRRAARGRP